MDRWWWPTQSWETVSDSNIDTCCLTKRSWVPMHDLVRTLLRGVCILSVCGGSLRALCLPPTVQRHAVSGVRLTGVWMGVCLSVLVLWQPRCPVHPTSCPVASGTGDSFRGDPVDWEEDELKYLVGVPHPRVCFLLSVKTRNQKIEKNSTFK